MYSVHLCPGRVNNPISLGLDSEVSFPWGEGWMWLNKSTRTHCVYQDIFRLMFSYSLSLEDEIVSLVYTLLFMIFWPGLTLGPCPFIHPYLHTFNHILTYSTSNKILLCLRYSGVCYNYKKQ